MLRYWFTPPLFASLATAAPVPKGIKNPCPEGWKPSGETVKKTPSSVKLTSTAVYYQTESDPRGRRIVAHALCEFALAFEQDRRNFGRNECREGIAIDPTS